VNAHGLPGRVPAAVTHLRPAQQAEELRVVRAATVDSLAAIRSVVSTWARGAGLPADALVDLLLAVGEATANVVDHAYRGGAPGSVEVDLQVRARRSGRVIVARIRDHGRWRPESPPSRDRGRGLPMIRALAEKLRVATTAQGTEVFLELAV
jgi:anti-sigma regulatory factor (Ser/Thr protein kinase)